MIQVYNDFMPQNNNTNNKEGKIPGEPVNSNSKSSLEDTAVDKNSKKSLFCLSLL